MDMLKHNKGQAGGIVAVVIGLVVGVILLVGVLVPITTSTVSSQNSTYCTGKQSNTNTIFKNDLVPETATCYSGIFVSHSTRLVFEILNKNLLINQVFLRLN
jgi:hypothetical protein